MMLANPGRKFLDARWDSLNLKPETTNAPLHSLAVAYICVHRLWPADLASTP